VRNAMITGLYLMAESAGMYSARRMRDEPVLDSLLLPRTDEPDGRRMRRTNNGHRETPPCRPPSTRAAAATRPYEFLRFAAADAIVIRVNAHA
jgi:hypothetical protein